MKTRRLSADLIMLHWLVALLFLVTICAILARGELASGDPWRPMLRQWHASLGLLLWLSFWLRLGLRLLRGVPALPAEANWSRWVRRGVNLGLYAVMLAQPVLGLLQMQTDGKVVAFFGIALPAFIAEQSSLHHKLEAWHSGMAWAFYALLALHVGAALWHHFVRRDDVLLAMFEDPARSWPLLQGRDEAPHRTPSPI